MITVPYCISYRLRFKSILFICCGLHATGQTGHGFAVLLCPSVCAPFYANTVTVTSQ